MASLQPSIRLTPARDWPNWPDWLALPTRHSQHVKPPVTLEGRVALVTRGWAGRFNEARLCRTGDPAQACIPQINPASDGPEAGQWVSHDYIDGKNQENTTNDILQDGWLATRRAGCGGAGPPWGSAPASDIFIGSTQRWAFPAPTRPTSEEPPSSAPTPNPFVPSNMSATVPFH